jgi:glutamyl-tRNA synthetase
MNITRLAPSPTGALHLGNARTFLVNWLLARQGGWRIILRIEDLDGPRVKAGADREAIDDLIWLGLDWDEGPIYQSRRRERYADALDRLIADGKVYPCTCSRREIEESASAPHGESGAIYPGTCRGRYRSGAEAQAASGRMPAMRFAVPPGTVRFIDGVRGLQEIEPATELGDFVVAKADGTPAYQLAVVVDDAEMGTTDVVRGDDLLGSTARQRLIYDALGWADRVPRYSHLPLVIGGDGRRLAKRHGDTRLSRYRNAGVSASAVVALLGRWCGIEAVGEQATSSDLLASFRIEKLPREPITFTPADEAMLLAGGRA